MIIFAGDHEGRKRERGGKGEGGREGGRGVHRWPSEDNQFLLGCEEAEDTHLLLEPLECTCSHIHVLNTYYAHIHTRTIIQALLHQNLYITI